MKKYIKILLAIVIVILIFVVIGFFLVRSFLTPAYLKTIASKMASEAIQHPVEIGNVHLKIGLKIGIAIDNISIPNAPGFSPEPVVKINRTSLNLQLLPLLRRKIVVGSIDLDGLKLKAEKNSQNQMNIGIFLPKTGSKGRGWSLSLNSINIVNSEVLYIDGITKTELQAKDIKQNIRISGSTFSFAGEQTIYFLKSKQLPETIIKIEDNFVYDSATKDVNVRKFVARYEPIYLSISGMIEKMDRLNMTAEINITDASKILPLVPSESRPDKLTGSVKAAASILGTIKEPKVDGRCELKNISMKPKGFSRDIENIGGSLSFDQNSIKNILIQGQISETKFEISGSLANLNDPGLDLGVKLVGNLKDIEGLTPETEGIRMSGPLMINAAIKGTAKKPSYYGDYSIDNGSIDGIGLAKPITNFRIKGALQSDAAKITDCSGHIGNSDFSFTGYISNFSNPVIQIQNSSNIIDLDELLPKPQKGKKQQGKAAPISMQGNMRINKLSGMDMEFRNVITSFSYENGIIDLKNGSANAFDGKVLLDLYYNINSPEPYRLSVRMTNFSAQKVLKRFLKFDNLEARLNGIGNFQGKGFGQKEVITNLSASGNFKFNSGVFKNFAMITGLLAWLGLKDQNELRFNDFVCYFKINNGKTKVEDWALATTVGNFLTNGTVGLDGKVNLAVTLTLNKKESDLLKKYHGEWLLYYDKSGKATVDMNITGRIASPQFKLDADKIKKRLKGKIEDEWDKKKKELEKKLKDLFKK